MPKNPSTSGPKTAKTASRTTNADPVGADADASAALSATQRAVLQRLSEAAAGMSPGEMAAAESIGLSTARKALAALETAGLARRELGVRDGAQKSPDQWFAAESGTGAGPEPAQDARQATATGNDTTDADTPADHAVTEQDDDQPDPDGTASEPADFTPGQQATDTANQEPDTPHAHAAKELGDSAAGDEGGEDDAGPDATDSAQETVTVEDPAATSGAASPPSDATGEDDAAPQLDASATTTSPAPAPATKSGPRLGKGELRMMVEQFLRDHPEQAWTSGQMAKALGRSAGAVHNAAVKLVEDGKALTFEDAPHRFQIIPAPAAEGARRATTTAPKSTA